MPHLFHFPGACSRVTINALEEIRLDYTDEAINLRTGEQRTEAYLRVNPKGKVPALIIGAFTITENPAILFYLQQTYPAARLLPIKETPLSSTIGLTDMLWCSATLHIAVRQIMRPESFTNDAASVDGVRNAGVATYKAAAKQLNDRFANGAWWYGDAWSILDVYLYWTYSTAGKGGFPLGDYPAIFEHAKRVQARPSFQRARNREAQAASDAGLVQDFARADEQFA